MNAYYSENDPHAAQWLRNLVSRGLIAPGDVDERSIEDVQPDDVRGYDQCHWFAGIGGWSLALRLAGVPDEWPVWTGSCPCQDHSLAGKRAGFAGERDLWPPWCRLIRIRKPLRILGEQVASSLEWYERMCDDLEAEDYTVGSLVIPACSIGAWHERERLWFIADAATLDGLAHDRMGTGGTGRTQAQPGRLLGLHVSGGWWTSDSWPERQPTLVRNHDGLPRVLGGFGNAIVPQVAAEFIRAYMELERT